MRYWLVVLFATLASCGGSSSPPSTQPVVEDTTSPIITLTGDNPQLIEAGEVYTELGATASDNIDGNLTASIVIDASTVNTSILGDYIVSYDVSDSSGNAAATVTRTVTVQDTTPPVITVLGGDPQVIIIGNPYTELGAKATDSLDGDLTAFIVIDASAVDTDAPGEYVVSYDVSDAAGNAAATATRTVQVENPPLPAAPTVSIEGDIKKLIFSWDAVTGAAYYRLLENADGHSGFTQVGDDIPAGTLATTRDIAVHLFDWVQAQYLVEACNIGGCNSSRVITATDVMLDTIGYFKASNTDPGDSFGGSAYPYGPFGGIALSGDGLTLAVGAPLERSAASGVSGDESDNSVEYSGAVYVFRKSPLGWRQQAYIKGSGTAYEWFGNAVALSDNGNTLAIGSGESGFRIYHYMTDQWNEQSVNIANARCQIGEGILGVSVALSLDGSTLVAGNPFDANYRLGVGGFTEPIPPPLYEESPMSGAVCVYRLVGDTWQDDVYIKPSDTREGALFGSAIALNDDGTLLAVGAPESGGGVYLFRFEGETWFEEVKLSGSDTQLNDLFGAAVALSADSDVLAVGSPHHPGKNHDDEEREGAVFVFRYEDDEWNEQSMIKPVHLSPSERFGTSVALATSGNRLAVGAPGDDSSSVGVDGDMLDNLAIGAGAVYVYRQASNSWLIEHYVKACNAQAADAFGRSVSLTPDGMTLAIGAVEEDSSATGVGGDREDNTAEESGAAYIY
jgi:hypothetical protein